MTVRPRSGVSRVLDTLPLFLVLGIALGGVFVAMNILVVAAPVVIAESPSPSASVEPSLAGSPSILPSATPYMSASPFATAKLPAGKPVVVRSVINVTDPGRTWTVYLEYPQFQKGTTPWAGVMNEDLANEMQTRATQWEQGPASVRVSRNKINVLTGSYATELVSPALAAFTITWTDDSTGDVPANLVETVNFDLSTGQRIDFDSMFADPDLALTLIQESARAQLVTQLGPNYDDAVVSDGIAPFRSNFVNWALTAAGLKITFAEYQVSQLPGFISVVVPWSALREAMAPGGPVAALAGL